MDQKRMQLEVQTQSIPKLFPLFWCHTSAPVLCGNITLHGSNAHN